MSLSSRHLFGMSVVLLVVCVSSGCIEENPATGRKELILISTAEEINMGLRFADQIDREYVLSKDVALNRRISGIGGRVAANSWRKELKYNFKVIDDNKVVNAFALPGGHVYITTGLMGKLKDEGEIAAVLAHEVAHVEARHSMKHLQTAMVAQGLTVAIFNKQEQETERLIAGLLSGLLSLRFSRHHELEADGIGIDYAYRAGYDPWGMAGVMEVLGDLEKKGGGVPIFLRTHPLSDERMKEAAKKAGRIKPRPA